MAGGLVRSSTVVSMAVVMGCGLASWGNLCRGQNPSPLRIAEPGKPLATVPGNAPAPDAVNRLIDPRDDGRHGPSPRTLDEFVALAQENHPKLRSARAMVEAARGKAVQAKLYPNPLAYAGSPQATAPGSGAANGGNGSSTQFFSQMSQDIVTAGKLRLSQQAALREVQRAEYELIRARFDVLRDVRQSYYALLVSQRRVEIYKLLLDIAKRSYEIGRQLAEAGEGTKADVLFWSIERDRAEVRLLNAAVFIETELAFVEAQADRWNGAVSIADLLQLESFPPPADAPAVIDVDDGAAAVIPPLRFSSVMPSISTWISAPTLACQRNIRLVSAWPMPQMSSVRTVLRRWIIRPPKNNPISVATSPKDFTTPAISVLVKPISKRKGFVITPRNASPNL